MCIRMLTGKLQKMEIAWYFLCVIVLLRVGQGTGHLLPQEQLLVESFCDIQRMNISCDTNEMIAVHNFDFRYHPDCDTVCCQYDSNHTIANVGIELALEIRRECSGRRYCFLDYHGLRHFGLAGVQNPSYAVVHYYCIPDSRTASVCSSVEMTSQGLPLYLTNENYPSVTTGDSTCSCSLEVFMCSSAIKLFLVDLDLYYNTENCEQRLDFVDGNGVLMETIGCDSDNTLNLTEINLDSNYVKINFIDNSVQDEEGYFFFGFAATGTGAIFNLSCSYQPKSTCEAIRDCGDRSSVRHGNISLVDVNNSSHGALADVICNPGYETNTTTVKCMETNEWESSECFPKDCGDTPEIPNGEVTAVDNDNTRFGEFANVTCSEGFEANINIVTCTESGRWEEASCIAKDCGRINVLDNGQIELQADKSTFVGATATVSCLEGFTASVSTVRCQESGEWQNASCTIVDCGVPTGIPYGKVTLKASSTTFNALANVTCHDGYTPEKRTIRCTRTGAWEYTFCEHKDEGDILVFILPSVLTPLAFIVVTVGVLYIIRTCRRHRLNRQGTVEESVTSSKYEDLGSEKQIQCVNNPAFSFEGENKTE